MKEEHIKLYEAQKQVIELERQHPIGTRVDILGIPMLVVRIYSNFPEDEFFVCFVYNHDGKLEKIDLPAEILNDK